MRIITRGLGIAAAAALALAAVPGPAGAAPSGAESLYAPSALVLTVAPGALEDDLSVLRAVTLTCAPTPSGTHPDPAGACAELNATGAELDFVTDGGTSTACTREWNPYTVTADGVWQGQRFTYTHTFGNPCTMRNGKGTVFNF
ncbi:subtilase-type protease inhibitor [Streptomyces bambusae]|uniref:subtilase-type protease inhibitor n=1 Tax=Streptomyces bambusae TaxID=1550616 RepID=UPI001CFE621D|nr:subtilase-type protease inhibitor [Streptomyces bambusae]MCB5165759.1 subtilase-type protease inhibitor [Streptomyces bambusae]